MTKKECAYCGQTAWHNKTTKEGGGWRCTKCGYPFSTNPAKSEYQRALGQKLAKRLI